MARLQWAPYGLRALPVTEEGKFALALLAVAAIVVVGLAIVAARVLIVFAGLVSQLPLLLMLLLFILFPPTLLAYLSGLGFAMIADAREDASTRKRLSRREREEARMAREERKRKRALGYDYDV